MPGQHTIKAVLLDCGDTLVDESTQQWSPDGQIALRADLIPGADDLVRELKRLDYPLGLVADGPSGTFHNILGEYGLYHLFDAHAISQEVGVEKPDAAMYLTALNQLGVAPQDYARVVMLGNHLARDVRGANALGLISVWLDWSPRRPKVPADDAERPRFTIHLPMELLPLLSALENDLATPDNLPAGTS